MLGSFGALRSYSGVRGPLMSRDGGDSHIQETGAKLRIVIASSILLYREGLAASVTSDGRLEVVGQTDLNSAAELSRKLLPDALVLDASTAEGLALARQMKGEAQNLPLVGFGISGSPADVIGCAESGLAGFIDQESSIDALVKVVSDAVRGEFNCSPQVTSILCTRLARLADRGMVIPNSLTARERQIAGMVAEGLSNKEIAQGLRIGPATVKNHVHNILDKLHVRRRAAIASRVLEATR
jgi:DNA-binding NarL/FixJ family response regulator